MPNGANEAAGVLFFNALIRFVVAWVAESAEKILGVLVFQEIILLYLQSVLIWCLKCTIYKSGIYQLQVLCTIFVNHIYSMGDFCWFSHGLLSW